MFEKQKEGALGGGEAGNIRREAEGQQQDPAEKARGLGGGNVCQGRGGCDLAFVGRLGGSQGWRGWQGRGPG